MKKTIVLLTAGLIIGISPYSSAANSLLAPPGLHLKPSKEIPILTGKSLNHEIKLKNNRWYRGLQSFFNKYIPHPITVYYPGCGLDFNHAVSATNADIFLFADFNENFPANIKDEIKREGGKIIRLHKESNFYVLNFILWEKERLLYYFTGIDVSRENNLPELIKNGYDILLEKKFSYSYGGADNGISAVNLGFKYLRQNGFYLLDYLISDDTSFKERHNKHYKKIIKLGSRLQGGGWDSQSFICLVQIIKTEPPLKHWTIISGLCHKLIEALHIKKSS